MKSEKFMQTATENKQTEFTKDEKLKLLNNFLVNNPELEELSAKLGIFNILRAKIQDKSGNAFLVQQIELLIKAGVKTSPIKLNPKEFVGVSIAHGTTENIFDDDKLTDEKVQILFVKEKGGKEKKIYAITGIYLLRYLKVFYRLITKKRKCN